MRLIDFECKQMTHLVGNLEERFKPMEEDGWKEISSFVDAVYERVPVVDPTKHGKWERVSPSHIYECSVCHQFVVTDDIDVYEYCHRCGAKMDGDK